MDTTLFSRISTAIATTLDTTVLLRTIVAELQPVFDFYDVGVFVVKEAEDYHIDLAAETPEISPSKGSHALFERQLHQIPHSNSAIAWMMQQAETAGQPVLLDFQDLMIRFPDYPQWEVMQPIGYRDCLVTVLRVRGEVIGMFCLNSLKKDHFSPEQFPLFQSIADQVAITLSNILAQEEVLAEKTKVERLHFVSEVMTGIRHRRQLKLAFDRIQTVFPFDNAGLFVLTEDGQQHYELLDSQTLHDDPTQQQLEQQFGRYARFPHPNSPVEEMMQTEEVTLYDFSELLDRYPDYPQSDAIRQAGLRQLIAAPLRQGEKIIGLLNFNSQQASQYSQADFAFVQAVAEQMSTVVSNVLVNESMQQEKQFKETLLRVSEAVARIQDRKELFTTILDQIHHLIPIDDVAIVVLNNQEEWQDWAVNENYLGTQPNRDMHAAGLGGYHPMDSLTQKITSGTGIISMEEITEQHSDHPFVPLFFLQEFMYTPLRIGGTVIGSIAVYAFTSDTYTEKHFPLFQAVADQLAVAVSNVLANEEIRQREQSKHLQVQVIHALNQTTDWPKKLLAVIRLLQPHLDIHLVIFAIHTEGSNHYCYAFERIGADEYRVFDYPSFLRFTGMSESEYHQPGAAYDQLVRATGEEFEQLTRDNPAMRTTADSFGLRSWLHLPLQIGMDGQFRLGILSQRANAYGEPDLHQLRTLQPSLELALGRSLAFEQIARLNEELLQEKSYLQEELKTTYNFEHIIGHGESMQTVFHQVQQVAHTDSNVLIYGETGTGKELIARALHDASPRRNKPLVKVNCAALPEHLIESELFGHVKGAFTGAVQARVGKFELAHQGTIFLDEIGELPLALQAKLLRVLQEREFEKLGSNQLIRSDFRVIAATNRSLEEEAARGAFRLDLLYRLSSFPLRIPALRERREDIPLLADHFARLYTQKLAKPFRGFTAASQHHFQQYAWPGNVRELQNVIEQAAIVTQSPVLDIAARTAPQIEPPLPNDTVAPDSVDIHHIKAQQDALERQYILAVLEKTHWKVSGEAGAAAQLKLKPTTLEYRMKKLGIER